MLESIVSAPLGDEQKGEDPDMIRLERDAVKELIKTSENENKYP